MKWFEYGDEKISHREIMIAIPSMVIGVGVLSFPRQLAAETVGPDGWVSILVSGIIMIFFAWLLARLAARFPHQSFLDYASKIISKPVAIAITFVFIIISIGIVAIEVREISEIAKQYLFDKTPLEAVSLIFLLVVVYAVSGSRAGIFRLNMMFLPIIIFIALAVMVLNIGWFSIDHVLPVFETNIQGYFGGMRTGILAYMGIMIILFYTSLVKKPEKVPKSAAIGMCIPVALYLLLFIASIGVFGHSVTSNMIFPIIELAKVADIPGGFFERFESIFFVIWVMAIFNTAAMAMDIAVLSLGWLFKDVSKIVFICILSPVVYLIAMYPEDLIMIMSLAGYFGYFTIAFTCGVTIILFLVAKLRKVKRID